LHLLRDRRCLLVLDDFQDIFIPGQLAGHYQPEAQDYQTLLTKITEIDHQSTVLVISQEKNQQMIALDRESPLAYLPFFENMSDR